MSMWSYEPNVNILNNVDVNVTDDETNPVPVVVQNGNGMPAEKEFVEIFQADVESGILLGVVTVETGKHLVITDVVVTSDSTAVSASQILRDGSVVSLFGVPGRCGSVLDCGSYQQSYATGIQFAEGETVGIKGSDSTGLPLTSWELRGYQTDVNGS